MIGRRRRIRGGCSQHDRQAIDEQLQKDSCIDWTGTEEDVVPLHAECVLTYLPADGFYVRMVYLMMVAIAGWMGGWVMVVKWVLSSSSAAALKSWRICHDRTSFSCLFCIICCFVVEWIGILSWTWRCKLYYCCRFMEMNASGWRHPFSRL